ncbi:MAG TPA: HAMP domain-containing sensor histidine kinase, partial [Limnochordales bacterium]
LRADLEVALQEHPEGSPCRAPLERALAQVVRLSRLADDLLALARYERGGLVRPVPGSDLTASIRQALADVRHLAERAGVTVVADLPDRLEATCDPAAVARVVTNLLRNAVEASPQGGTVTVAAGQQGPWAWIEVEDEGPGMTPEQAARCFEPFYHSRPASAGERDGAGTGLGLAISKAIVDAHDGRITLDTAPERGTRVRVWLPRGHRQPLPPAGLQEQAAAG